MLCDAVPLKDFRRDVVEHTNALKARRRWEDDHPVDVDATAELRRRVATWRVVYSEYTFLAEQHKHQQRVLKQAGAGALPREGEEYSDE